MPQIIPLVVTAITAVTSAVVAAGPLAVAAFNAANVIGAAALANEAFKAVQPSVKSSSTAIEWNADPNAPNRFPFGRVGGAGNIIHNATYGPDKMYVGFVGVMGASGPIKSWISLKADDAFVNFDGSGKAIDSDYAGEMFIRRQRGLQPEASYLPSPPGLKNGAAMPRWGMSYKLSGKAAYHYTLAENSKRSAFKGKVPTGIHTIEGLYCYDPRFDSTYPGGTGPCRIDDPTTWVYSTNAYIHGLNWNIGRWEGLATGYSPARYGVPYASMKVGGIGARPDGIDFAAYVEAANVFDENAWVCAAWPDADQGKGAVLDSFLQAGGGIYAERQGKMSCLHRAAPRASMVTITADDTAGTIEYDTTTSLLERINTIRPEYWSEAHGWQMVATDEVTSSVWREEDGQGVEVTKSKGLAYNYVPQSKQARELAALQIAHTREGIRGTAPLRHYLDLEVGDCFTFEVPEAVLNGQKCMVLNVDPDLENDIINVTFASESDGKYPFAFGQADAPPPAPGLQPSSTFVSPPLPGDWTITPRPPAPGGGQLPGFDLGGVVSNDTATAIIVEYGPSATGPWKQAYQGPPTVTNIPIDGLQPGATYYVAIQYQRNQNYSDRYVFGPYTAPLLDPSPNAPTIVGLQDQITTAFGDIFDVSGLLADARADIDAQGVEIAAARGGQPNLNSRIVQVNQAQIDGDEANAEAISLVQARTANTEADIIDLENALASETGARAEAINQVEARSGVNDVLDSEFRGYVAGDTSWGFASNYGSASPGANFDVYWSANQNVLYSFLNDNPPAGALGDWRSGWMTAEATARYEGGAMLAVHAAVGQVWMEFGDADKNVIANPLLATGGRGGGGHGGDPSNFDLVGGFASAPAGTAYRRLLVRNLSPGGVSYAFMPFIRPYSRPATATQTVLSGYSEGVSTQINATVTQQSLAIIDLENQQALAMWQVKTAASGGKPTVLSLISSSFGSAIAMAAEQIYFGENTVFDDPTDQLITVTNGVRRVLAWGAAFGSGADAGQLTEWEGPDSIALNAMTRANATFFRANAEPYVGGSGLNAGVFTAQANLGTAVGSRTSAGQVTTATVTLTASGNTGTLTYAWSQIGGNEEWTITTPTGASTTFRVNVATPGEQKRATFACRISDSGTGKTVTVIVGGAALYNV